MDFVEAEGVFRGLKEEHRQGLIDAEALEAAMSQIRVLDAHGQQWMIGVQSGSWYVLGANGEWRASDPHASDTDPARCIECGRPVEPGRGLCESCLHEAITGTALLNAPASTRDVEERPARNGLLQLALTGVILIAVCVLLFALQAAGSRWLSPAVAVRATTPPVPVATDSEPWPPAPLPTSTRRVETATSLPVTATPTTQPATITPSPVTTRTAPEPQPEAGQTPDAGAPLSGRLLYPGFDSVAGTFSVYERLADASGPEREVARQASQIAVSNRGEMAYRSWDNSSRGLMVAPVTGEAARRVVAFSEAARPSWSPSGDELLFYSLQESDRKSRIYRARTDGSFAVVKQGSESVFGDGPSYLPDGRFVLRTCTDGRCGLYLMGFEGQAPLLLVEDAAAAAPEASPDGKRIAYMSQGSGSWDVFVAVTDGGQLPQRLTASAADEGLPVWSPDGSALAYTWYDGREWAIRAVAPDGANDRLLVRLDRPLDGRVRSAQDYESRGWIDERICWVR